MNPSDLDEVYTELANAIADSGPRSELFLAMLALRLIGASGDAVTCREALRRTLQELHAQP